MTTSTFLIFCILGLATVAFGNPIGTTEVQNQGLTPEKVTAFANGILTYKQFVPADDLVVELEGMVKDPSEVQELIYFITTPTSGFAPAEAMRFKKECPKLFTRVSRIFLSTVLRIISLSPPAQQWFSENSKPRASGTTADSVRFFAQMKKSFDKLPIEVQKEYAVQFPELFNLFSTPAYQHFINTLVELNNKTDDEITVGTTMAIRTLVTEFLSINH